MGGAKLERLDEEQIAGASMAQVRRGNVNDVEGVSGDLSRSFGEIPREWIRCCLYDICCK